MTKKKNIWDFDTSKPFNPNNISEFFYVLIISF